MRGNEALLTAARVVVIDLEIQGANLQNKRALRKVEMAVWKRHRLMAQNGYARLTSRSWRDVSPSWRGRYRKLAQQAIALEVM